MKSVESRTLQAELLTRTSRCEIERLNDKDISVKLGYFLYTENSDVAMKLDEIESLYTKIDTFIAYGYFKRAFRHICAMSHSIDELADMLNNF